jgi:hypothetical protein
MPEGTEALKKELAEARTEIENLRLRLSNATLLLRKELLAKKSLLKLDPAIHDVSLN